MKVVATVEARMGSTRLPGKVMLPALGKPMLYYVIERLKAARSLDRIVIATTTKEEDDVIANFARDQGVDTFRGSEHDVMSRVIGAADSVDADVVVEITGDCPLVDPDLVEQTIRVFKYNEGVSYCANSYISSYPDGMDTQVIDLRALKESYTMTDSKLDREHVSRYIVNHPEIFRHAYLIAPPSLEWPGLGLTLDEQSDYELIKAIIEALGKESVTFGCREIISFLRANPRLLQINSDVKRKNVRPR